MLRADQFELIDKLFKDIFKNDKPFGGLTMIFTGDFFQIPPVVKSWEKNKDQWLFESKTWLDAHIKVLNLTEIHRQLDPAFQALLNNVRKGVWNKTIEKTIEKCKENNLPDTTTKFFSTNDECEECNVRNLEELPGKYSIYQATVVARRDKIAKAAMINDVIAKETLN